MKKYEIEKNEMTYIDFYNRFNLLRENFALNAMHYGSYAGSVSALIKKKLSVVKVEFLIEIANDLKLDMTYTTAESILKIVFNSSNERSILLDVFATSGRDASDKSLDFLKHQERFEYYAQHNLGEKILNTEKERLKKVRDFNGENPKLKFTKTDLKTSLRKSLDEQFNEILAERERKKEYEKNHELNFDDQPTPAPADG